ncbi:MAG: hypothetical protein ACT4OP_12760 [Actinomycetota bacterium]
MPPTLKARLALVVLFGVFLIPVGMSSLRGLTHVVSCTGEAVQPFEVDFSDPDSPILTGSAVVEAGDDPVCGALVADLSVQSAGKNRLEVTVPIENRGTQPWRGTVNLEVGNVLIPIRIGVVPGGETRSETIVLRLPVGITGFSGRLLIGP